MRNSLSPLFFLVSFLVTGETIFAQDTIQRPSLQSTKITNPPKIDGKLDDGVWKNLPVATLDITWLPEYGKVPTRKTEVKVVYDNTAIYIGAMLYDSVPANIHMMMI